jgi:hypothetical protein
MPLLSPAPSPSSSQTTLSTRILSSRMTGFALFALLCVSLSGSLYAKPAPAPKLPPDVIVFTNGDQLTGKFLRSTGGAVAFHSDIAGDINVPWDKVKELRSATTFAVFEKGIPLTKTPATSVPQGTVTVVDQKLAIKQASGDVKEIPTKHAAFVIDETTFDRQIQHSPNLLHGWAGALTGGASLVEATQDTTTFTGSVALVRAVPSVTWLDPRNRTTLDFNGSYGKITQPQGDGAPPLPDVKTAIYHADAERDQYFSPRFYVLAQTAFDHNFSQGLDLQQIYGAGVGRTVIKRPKQTLDIKATIQYEEQQFLNVSAGTDENLIGSTFAAAYLLKLPRNIIFNEQAAYIPAYNNVHAYSANETSTVSLPVYKRLSFTVGTIDSYLNDPPIVVFPAPDNKRNSFEFTTGVTYSLGPH